MHFRWHSTASISAEQSLKSREHRIREKKSHSVSQFLQEYAILAKIYFHHLIFISKREWCDLLVKIAIVSFLTCMTVWRNEAIFVGWESTTGRNRQIHKPTMTGASKCKIHDICFDLENHWCAEGRCIIIFGIDQQIYRASKSAFHI